MKDGAQILNKIARHRSARSNDPLARTGASNAGEITAEQIRCRLAEEEEEEGILRKLLQESLDEERMN